MENRVTRRMTQLKASGGKSLSIVVMIGDPDIKTTYELLDIALETGIDVFEIGIPTSNPILDSKVMHESMSRALKFSQDYDWYLKILGEMRAKFPDTAFEIMIYHETVEKIGLEKFCTSLVASQMDSVLVADGVYKGIEYLHRLDQLLLSNDVYPIRFVPHPFQPSQFDDLRQNAHGFIVLQTKTDSQGRRDTILDENRTSIDLIHQAGIRIPLVLAYGIRTPAEAHKCISLGADGVLIGTVLLDTAYHLPRRKFKIMLKNLREAVASG